MKTLLHTVRALAIVAPICAAGAASAVEPVAVAPTATAKSSPPERFDLLEDGHLPRLSWRVGDDHVLTLDPGTDLYPRYLADPRREKIGLEYMRAIHPKVPDSGGSRFNISIGGQLPLLRLSPLDQPESGFQLDAHAGFFGQFDLEHSWDNVGWDGTYGIGVTFAPGGPVRFRLSTRHESSHLGDELMAREQDHGHPLERMNYTREDFSFGVAVSPADHLTLYAEPSWAYSMGNPDKQSRLAVQLGTQYERPDAFWDGRAGYYIGADAQFFQENNWSPGVTGQIGLELPIFRERRYRLFLEGHFGRSALGEFSQTKESYLSFGISFDL